MQLFATLVPEDFRGASTNRWSVFTSAPLSCVGTALTLSLLVVYLHNVRRVSITFATILLALTAIAGLAISPLSGTLVDRVGPVAVIVPMFLGEAGSLMLRAFARHKPQIIVAALLLAFFGGEAWGLAGSLAPAITAFFFSEHWGNYWPIFVGGTSLCGSFLMLRHRRRLSAREDGTEPVAQDA